MNREEIDRQFEYFFEEAVKEGITRITAPADEALDASWDRMRKLLRLKRTAGGREGEAYVEL